MGSKIEQTTLLKLLKTHVNNVSMTDCIISTFIHFVNHLSCSGSQEQYSCFSKRQCTWWTGRRSAAGLTHIDRQPHRQFRVCCASNKPSCLWRAVENLKGNPDWLRKLYKERPHQPAGLKPGPFFGVGFLATSRVHSTFSFLGKCLAL